MSINVRELIDLLKFAQLEQVDRDIYLEKFKQAVWNSDSDSIVGINETIFDVLLDLACALDDYVADPEWRKQADEYFGEEKLKEEINKAFEELRALGLDV